MENSKLKSATQIKTIIFDMGNVLLNYDAKKAAERFSKACKVPVMKIWVHFFTSQIEKAYTRGEISSEQFYHYSKEALRAPIGFETFKFYWNDIFTENHGMEDLLNRLERKYPLYLLSNTNEMHFSFIREKFPHIFRHFTIAFASHELGCRKPDRKIFEKVLGQIGSKAEETVFIDDAPKFVEGARKVGIHAICFKSKEQLVKDLKKRGVEVG